MSRALERASTFAPARRWRARRRPAGRVRRERRPRPRPLRADGPYGFAADSAPYDEAIIQALVRGNRLGELVDWDPERRRRREGGQLLAAADAARRDRRSLFEVELLVLRGADVLRDAHRLLLPAGLSAGSAKCPCMAAQDGGPTRRPRRRPVASKKRTRRAPRTLAPPPRADRSRPRRGRRLPRGRPVVRVQRRPGRRPRHAAIGAAAYLAPVVLVPLGALVVARSALVDVRPFRLGLAVALTGLLLTLGAAHGGAVGDALESLVALGLGTTGATILGVLLTIAGLLFLTGASLGAILRRTGHAVQLGAHARARREADARAPGERASSETERPSSRPSTSSTTTRISSPTRSPGHRRCSSRRSRTSSTCRPRENSQETLFDPPAPARADYKLPDRRLLRARSRAAARTVKPDSASPRRSSPASRTSASTRR